MSSAAAADMTVAQAAARPGARCQNCGAPVSARYCAACGQRVEAPVHSLWHFAQLAAEDLTGWISAAVTLYIAWYAYGSMRVMYGQGRSVTLGKLVLLSFFYLVSGSLMLALVSVYSVFTL